MSNTKTYTSPAEKYSIGGVYSLQDIKYDLLKIIEPHDGLMYNRKDTEKVKQIFSSYLTDLQRSWKMRDHSIYISEKANAFTFDIEIRIHKDRSPKKLKIHVGKLVHYRDRKTA
jgi:hypothetical protein